MKKYSMTPNYVKKQKNKGMYKSTITKECIIPDLIKRQWNKITEPLSVITTDVSYLIWNGQKAYISTMMDCFTKEIIDFKISYKNDLNLVMENLKDTIKKIRQIKKDLTETIILSDHAQTYNSNVFKTEIQSNNMKQSMGSNFACYDNIIIESWHSRLKCGTIHNNKYNSLHEYIFDVVDWCNHYNKYRKKSNFPLQNWEIRL
ncbi:DDE-type integrase/transposase/recombinase [Spiroplasma endosymbiont of Labia minor]|uniref:DDE-type integrase/transposase/recombinase n=1 Tax=Spiroplasma endosymbiont of Labia minor TaxID=3066305 RepID=UPI0030D19AE1